MFWPETQPDLKPLKHAAMLNPESLPETTPADFQFDYIDIGSVTYSKGITEKQAMVFSDAPSRARKPVKENDLIISTVRTYLRAIAKIGASDTGSVASTGFAVCRPRDGTQPNYLYYAVHSQPFIEQIVALSTGMSYPAINPSTLGDIRLPLPSPSKQTAIANFLDRETTQIDGLIEKKKKFIALLKEKRAAVITHAVTKGVDPEVAMKDACAPWIEAIPAHWDQKPFYAVARARKIKNKGMQEDNLLSLSYGNIVRKDINTPTGLLPESFETYQIVEANDVVFRLTDLQNDKRSLRSAICSERGIITSAYLAAQTEGFQPAFLNYLMRAYDVQKVFYSMGGGMRQSLGYEDIRRMPVVVPPIEEQTAIATFLDRETTRIDGLIAKTERSIDLLKEKRSALITAAVTGKIDVRNAA